MLVRVHVSWKIRCALIMNIIRLGREFISQKIVMREIKMSDSNRIFQ